MLDKIIEFSIRNKLIIGLFTIALIGLGLYEATKLPIDAQPDITNNQVQVITVAPSLGANVWLLSLSNRQTAISTVLPKYGVFPALDYRW